MLSVESIDYDNGVRLIRFSGQSATQSFSREFLPIIAQAIDAGLTHPNVRALVLTGDGKFFSAGADIHAFARSIEDGDAPQLIRTHSHLLLLKTVPSVLTRIHSHAMHSICNDEYQ